MATGLVALFALVSPAHAATFTANSTDEGADQGTANGICDTGLLIFPTLEPRCTLRAAIQQANATSGEDTVTFAVISVTLSVAGSSEDAAATGGLAETFVNVVSDAILGACARSITRCGTQVLDYRASRAFP